MAEKVYCVRCRWFHGRDMWDQCWHPDNHIDTYRRPKEKLKNEPEDLNKDNDCSWYEPKKMRLSRCA